MRLVAAPGGLCDGYRSIGKNETPCNVIEVRTIMSVLLITYAVYHRPVAAACGSLMSPPWWPARRRHRPRRQPRERAHALVCFSSDGRDTGLPDAGDWLSGRAPRSHRGGHWFDPSIAHPGQRPDRIGKARPAAVLQHRSTAVASFGGGRGCEPTASSHVSSHTPPGGQRLRQRGVTGTRHTGRPGRARCFPAGVNDCAGGAGTTAARGPEKTSARPRASAARGRLRGPALRRMQTWPGGAPR